MQVLLVHDVDSVDTHGEHRTAASLQAQAADVSTVTHLSRSEAAALWQVSLAAQVVSWVVSKLLECSATPVAGWASGVNAESVDAAHSRSFARSIHQICLEFIGGILALEELFVHGSPVSTPLHL